MSGIQLWEPRRVADERDQMISNISMPPPYIPGSYVDQYEDATFRTKSAIPCLAWFCLGSTYKKCNKLELGEHFRRLPFQPTTVECDERLFHHLFPHGDPSRVDPRIWASFVQLYELTDDLEHASFSTYTLPLEDIHLPLLNSIIPSRGFMFIVILELPGCSDLTDETIAALDKLQLLVAFDASRTRLTHYGVKKLADLTQEGLKGFRHYHGPRYLRMLRLQNCSGVKNKIWEVLRPFSLLSVLDLRGTKCYIPDSSTFLPCGQQGEKLFYPTPITESLTVLEERYPSTLYSANIKDTAKIVVDSLRHPDIRPVSQMSDSFLKDSYTFASSNSSFTSSVATMAHSKLGPSIPTFERHLGQNALHGVPPQRFYANKHRPLKDVGYSAKATLARRDVVRDLFQENNWNGLSLYREVVPWVQEPISSVPPVHQKKAGLPAHAKLSQSSSLVPPTNSAASASLTALREACIRRPQSKVTLSSPASQNRPKGTKVNPFSAKGPSRPSSILKAVEDSKKFQFT